MAMKNSIVAKLKEKMAENKVILELFTGFDKMPAGWLFNFISFNFLI